MANDSWAQMPADINQWTTFIIESLSRRIPEIPPLIAGVEMIKLDPVLGSADGVMYLIGGMACAPIIIRNGKLAPIDTLMSNHGEFLPLSDAFLQKVYADNVIGEPSNEPGMGEDQVAEGPGQRIQYYNTTSGVNNNPLKMASFEQKSSLRSAIEKSAALLTFFNEHRPDILHDLYTAKPDTIKTAAEPKVDNMPKLHFLSNEDGKYSFNGEAITTKEAAAFMDAVNTDIEARTSLLKGGHICLDYRDKTSSVRFALSDVVVDKYPGESKASVATVMDLYGEEHRGILYRLETHDKYSVNYMHLFICDTFHSIQNDIHVITSVPISLAEVMEASQHVAPQIGNFGVVISEHKITMPFVVCGVEGFGVLATIKALTHEIVHDDYTIGGDRFFYEVPVENRSLVRNAQAAMQAFPGQNFTIGLDGDGGIVVSGKSDSYINSVYSMMDKMAMSYEDAILVANKVVTEGKAVFKVAAKEDNKSKDTKSKDKPKTDTKPAAKKEPAQQAAPAQPQMPPIQPVTSQDLEDVAKVNDPNLMDAYLTGKLTDVNTAGREAMLQASDNILNALKSLGKLLYLIRMGKIDYVKEEDAQLAMNKLSDVARSIGISPSQVM